MSRYNPPPRSVLTQRIAPHSPNFRIGVGPRLRCQTEASMSRPSQTESTYVQTFVRSPDIVRSCSDFRAFFDVSRLCNFERTTPPSCVHLRSGHTCFRLGPQPGLQWKDANFLNPLPPESTTSLISRTLT